MEKVVRRKTGITTKAQRLYGKQLQLARSSSNDDDDDGNEIPTRITIVPAINNINNNHRNCNTNSNHDHSHNTGNH